MLTWRVVNQPLDGVFGQLFKLGDIACQIRLMGIGGQSAQGGIGAAIEIAFLVSGLSLLGHLGLDRISECR
jgi:hypothetical protein